MAVNGARAPLGTGAPDADNHRPLGYVADFRPDRNCRASGPTAKWQRRQRELVQQAFEESEPVGSAMRFVDGPLGMRHHAQDIARFVDDPGNIAR